MALGLRSLQLAMPHHGKNWKKMGRQLTFVEFKDVNDKLRNRYPSDTLLWLNRIFSILWIPIGNELNFELRRKYL